MLKRNIFFQTFVLVISSILLAACGGGTTDSAGGSSGTTTTTTINTTTVEALNPTAGSNWNDYVNADGDPCDASNDNTCTNGGLQRVIYVANQTDCAGVTASDNLGVFDWSCEVSGGQARMVSNGFQPDKGISDLIDFASAPGAWKENYLTISNNGTDYVTEPLVWWSNNPIVEYTDGAQMQARYVYIISQNKTTTCVITVDKVTLIVNPNAVLTGNIEIYNASFAWVEGEIDANGAYFGVKLTSSKFSTLKNLTVSMATSGAGIDFHSSSNNTLSNVIASKNGFGVRFSGSSDNILTNITSLTNDSDGVYIDNLSEGNILTDITATGNGNAKNGTGIHLYSDNNAFFGSLTVGNNDNGNGNCSVSASITNPGLTNACDPVLPSVFTLITI